MTRIRLHWQVDEQQGIAEWPCTDNHGATGFELPQGNALLTVSPVCAEGPAAPASYIAPGAEQRRVIVGDTVSLGAVELVLVVYACGDQQCICE